MTVDVYVEFRRTRQRLSGRWNPNEAERRAAWEMLVELTTRVPVIPLRKNEGLLREALTSLYTLFEKTRGVLRAGGAEVALDRQGELSMAVITGHLLNQVVRPVLAYWHPELERWEATRDGPKREHELAWPRFDEFQELLEELRSTSSTSRKCTRWRRELKSFFASNSTMSHDSTSRAHAMRSNGQRAMGRRIETPGPVRTARAAERSASAEDGQRRKFASPTGPTPDRWARSTSEWRGNVTSEYMSADQRINPLARAGTGASLRITCAPTDLSASRSTASGISFYLLTGDTDTIATASLS